MPPDDTPTTLEIRLTEAEARDLLKMAEMYFAQKRALAELQQESAALRKALDDALKSASLASQTVADLEATNQALAKEVIQTKDASDKALLVEQKRKWKWALTAFVAGVIFGFIAGQ